VVERITITGRIVNDEKELREKALEQLRDLPRVPLDAECTIGDNWPTLIECDYAALERRVLERLR